MPSQPPATRPPIRVIALAIAWRGSELLLLKGSDEVRGDFFYRPPGGGVEFGETSSGAVRREMMEEFGAAVTLKRSLGVIEDVFTYRGEAGHQVAFLHEVEFEERGFYAREEIDFVEAEWDGPATWRPLASFAAGPDRLVPEGLFAILSAARPGR
ncbi:MAG: NUDIX domain-containing protein [Dehalococcoidia bacterium]|nr:MAG: NUDIX domain-containing protein [bacterium]MCK6563509.1 NUDIX domain-containing protein [Dehalococcoidia bacterium]MCL4230183.1 NUDIX domain-containing protein [Dehalococcoidia bacterium]NUQ56763.1 NUDIX domain-containing protein [Dehalococcoidia bacterium]